MSSATAARTAMAATVLSPWLRRRRRRMVMRPIALLRFRAGNNFSGERISCFSPNSWGGLFVVAIGSIFCGGKSCRICTFRRPRQRRWHRRQRHRRICRRSSVDGQRKSQIVIPKSSKIQFK
ncbi:hypothetical protein ABFS83_01G112700 [Erythranthe nasuta]